MTVRAAPEAPADAPAEAPTEALAEVSVPVEEPDTPNDAADASAEAPLLGGLETEGEEAPVADDAPAPGAEQQGEGG